VAELADAADSKSAGFTLVPVRVRPAAVKLQGISEWIPLKLFVYGLERGMSMDRADFSIYSITEPPFKIYGLAVADSEKREFHRLTDDIMEKMPQYQFLGRRAVGGRVRFITDSMEIYICMTLAGAKEDINIPLSGSAGADGYVGIGKEAKYLGYIAPSIHTNQEITIEKIWKKNEEGLSVITINLPRNDHLLGMEVGVCKGSIIKEAPDYAIEKPILFYGSSITEGGCASRVGNAYTSMVCRWLDANYYNFGFSGSARGETEFAEYIADFPEKSLFVYDYDHNSPSVEHLLHTHRLFFQIIRKKNPSLPVLMISRPDSDKAGAKERVAVIQKTYEEAKKAGDTRVWFLDGREFFGELGRTECTVDGTHPNVLGFMRMAEKIYPVIRDILYDAGGNG